jgi:hypothetical protein
MHIAIIGAGLAGLTSARQLQDLGHTVVLYEKSRSTGGRLSTRETELGGFDHGAQYFTAVSEPFKKQIAAWRRGGWVEPWEGRLVSIKEGKITPAGRGQQRMVAVPGMHALADHLAENLDVRCEHLVRRIEPYGKQWVLAVQADPVPISATAGPFDAVIIAMPADQAAALLEPAPAFAKQATSAHMEPCWALMLGFQQPLELDYDAAWVSNSRLGWICRDSSKPGRRAGEHWVGHASTDWSVEHLGDDPERAKDKLLKAFHEVTGSKVQPVYATVHRWRYAQSVKPLPVDCLWDKKLKLGLCGDWFAAGLEGGGRVENAVLSAHALVAKMSG